MIPSSTVPWLSAMGRTPGWCAASYAAVILWWLGYPDQALQRSHEALTPGPGAGASLQPGMRSSYFAAVLHQLRREGTTSPGAGRGSHRPRH